MQTSLLAALKAWMSTGDASMDLSSGLAISKATLARLADDGERAVDAWQAHGLLVESGGMVRVPPLICARLVDETNAETPRHLRCAPPLLSDEPRTSPQKPPAVAPSAIATTLRGIANSRRRARIAARAAPGYSSTLGPLLHGWSLEQLQLDSPERVDVVSGHVFDHPVYTDDSVLTTSALTRVEGRRVFTKNSSYAQREPNPQYPTLARLAC